MYVLDHLDSFEPFMVTEEGGIEGYVSNQIEPGHSAGNVTIVALAAALDRNILVYGWPYRLDLTQPHLVESLEGGGGNHPPLSIIHVNGVHYDMVESIPLPLAVAPAANPATMEQVYHYVELKRNEEQNTRDALNAQLRDFLTKLRLSAGGRGLRIAETAVLSPAVISSRQPRRRPDFLSDETSTVAASSSFRPPVAAGGTAVGSASNAAAAPAAAAATAAASAAAATTANSIEEDDHVDDDDPFDSVDDLNNVLESYNDHIVRAFVVLGGIMSSVELEDFNMVMGELLDCCRAWLRQDIKRRYKLRGIQALNLAYHRMVYTFVAKAILFHLQRLRKKNSSVNSSSSDDSTNSSSESSVCFEIYESRRIRYDEDMQRSLVLCTSRQSLRGLEDNLEHWIEREVHNLQWHPQFDPLHGDHDADITLEDESNNLLHLEVAGDALNLAFQRHDEVSEQFAFVGGKMEHVNKLVLKLPWPLSATEVRTPMVMVEGIVSTALIKQIVNVISIGKIEPIVVQDENGCDIFDSVGVTYNLQGDNNVDIVELEETIADSITNNIDLLCYLAMDNRILWLRDAGTILDDAANHRLTRQYWTLALKCFLHWSVLFSQEMRSMPNRQSIADYEDLHIEFFYKLNTRLFPYDVINDGDDDDGDEAKQLTVPELAARKDLQAIRCQLKLVTSRIDLLQNKGSTECHERDLIELVDRTVLTSLNQFLCDHFVKNNSGYHAEYDSLAAQLWRDVDLHRNLLLLICFINALPQRRKTCRLVHGLVKVLCAINDSYCYYYDYLLRLMELDNRWDQAIEKSFQPQRRPHSTTSSANNVAPDLEQQEVVEGSKGSMQVVIKLPFALTTYNCPARLNTKSQLQGIFDRHFETVKENLSEMEIIEIPSSPNCHYPHTISIGGVFEGSSEEWKARKPQIEQALEMLVKKCDVWFTPHNRRLSRLKACSDFIKANKADSPKAIESNLLSFELQRVQIGYLLCWMECNNSHEFEDYVNKHFELFELHKRWCCPKILDLTDDLVLQMLVSERRYGDSFHDVLNMTTESLAAVKRNEISIDKQPETLEKIQSLLDEGLEGAKFAKRHHSLQVFQRLALHHNFSSKWGTMVVWCMQYYSVVGDDEMDTVSRAVKMFIKLGDYHWAALIRARTIYLKDKNLSGRRNHQARLKVDIRHSFDEELAAA